MFERFSERARQVVVLAQDEARGLKHDFIGSEHLLLGLLREEEGIAARVLESFDLDVAYVRSRVREIVGEGNAVPTGQIPFTPHAKETLERALREAFALGHNYIGTEHILLGLRYEGVGARILADVGADAETIRGEVIGMLSGPPREIREVAAEARRETSKRTRPSKPLAVPIALGWLLFAVALAIGILIGWLIWG